MTDTQCYVFYPFPESTVFNTMINESMLLKIEYIPLFEVCKIGRADDCYRLRSHIRANLKYRRLNEYQLYQQKLYPTMNIA